MGFLSDIFGSKPTVPPLQKLDLGTEQKTAVSNNLAALPGTEQYVSQANKFTQDQIQQMLSNVIPNYGSITGQVSTDISSMLKGEIPLADQQVSQLRSVAKAFGGGYAGSPAQGNLVARDLGLMSLQEINQGLTSAEQWVGEMNNIYSRGAMNVGSFAVTPGQQASFDVEERNTAFQRDWMQSQINAMPDPTTVGLWNTGWSVVDAALSAYTGSSVSLGLIPKGGYGMPSGGGTPSAGAGEGGAAFDSVNPREIL